MAVRGRLAAARRRSRAGRGTGDVGGGTVRDGAGVDQALRLARQQHGDRARHERLREVLLFGAPLLGRTQPLRSEPSHVDRGIGDRTSRVLESEPATFPPSGVAVRRVEPHRGTRVVDGRRRRGTCRCGGDRLSRIGHPVVASTHPLGERRRVGARRPHRIGRRDRSAVVRPPPAVHAVVGGRPQRAISRERGVAGGVRGHQALPGAALPHPVDWPTCRRDSGGDGRGSGNRRHRSRGLRPTRLCGVVRGTRRRLVAVGLDERLSAGIPDASSRRHSPLHAPRRRAAPRASDLGRGCRRHRRADGRRGQMGDHARASGPRVRVAHE